MSITAEKVADNFAATTTQTMTEKEMRKRKPSGKKVYKPHLATKIKWALGDCMDRTIAAQIRMRNILNWIEQQRAFDAGDATRRARLGDLDHEIAALALDVSEMERILNKATEESKPADPKSADPKK